VEVLPDIVGPEPRIVFCGMASALSTKVRDHYYETPGNNFWEMLHESGLTDRRLGPTEELALPSYGLGVTDLVHTGPKPYNVEGLAGKVRAWQPEWIAFTSKAPSGARAGPLGLRRRRGVRAAGNERREPSARLRRPGRQAAVVA
jgi:TDG/mug DNA glycosylase family protein